MSSPTYPDVELAMRAKTDKQAFAELYDQTYEKIYGYLLRRCANEALAQDLTSETYLKALDKLYMYKPQPGKPFIAWLYQVAINELNMYYRKQNKYKFVELEKTPHLASQYQTDAQIKEEDDEKEKYAAYHAAQEFLATLAPIDQTIISLYYFEGKDFRDIAAIVNKLEGTIRTRIHRTKKKLLEHLNQKGFSGII